MTATVREPAPARLDVLAVIDHLALGGAEMLLGQFAAAAPRAGIALHVACFEHGDGSPAAEPLRAAGIEPVNLKVSGRPGPRHLRALRRHIATVKPAVIHTHLGTADLIGGIAARTFRLPAVSTIHEVIQRAEGMGRTRQNTFALGRRLCDSRVITVSESARRAYLEHGWSRSDRVVRIYNGIDVEPGAGAGVRRELGIEPGDLVVGMISALRPEKGHQTAIEAIGSLRERFPRLRLLIAGQGPSADALARLAAPLGGGVLMVGRRTDVMDVFDAIDVCLHPSRMDAFPTTLIEALAASVPVLASAVGGIPEIIDDGRSGVLLPAPPTASAVADGLAGLLGDPARRRALAQAGREAYLERFTADPWVEQTRALYDEIIAESGRRKGLPTGAPR
jgi:glycosyltransferase involved in cell wall biosynthesis